MHDKELYYKLLGLSAPWIVTDVDLDMGNAQVIVKLEHEKGIRFPCPECQAPSTVYDHQVRRWRHLDTCGFTTILEADVPRISCLDHGVKQVAVSWAEPGSRFTGLFEAIVISWLKAASIADVAGKLKLSWDAASGIMERAVRRGLARRALKPIKRLAIDETSFQKRHEYVTVVVDRENNAVVDVVDGRKKQTVKDWLEKNMDSLTELESVSMDMWEPYIRAFQEVLPDAAGAICFDGFHVASHFNKALDKVRAEEHRKFRKQGQSSPLTRTKHDWLKSASTMRVYADGFLNLTKQNLKTARAWRIKEAAAADCRSILPGSCDPQ